MEVLIIVTILLYMLSAAGYFAYLFFQEDYLHRVGYFLVLAGFICHTLAIVYNGIASGGFPVRNLHETLSIAGWAVAGFFLVFQSRFKLKVLGIYAAPLIALIMIAVAQVPNTPSQEQSIFKNFWLISHVVTVFIGNAAFALACGIGILYLLAGTCHKDQKSGIFFPPPAVSGYARWNRLHVHYRRLHPADLRFDQRVHLCQDALGSVLGLGSQGGLVGDHLAFLRRSAPRTVERRLAWTPGGHHGDHRFCHSSVHFSGGQLFAQGASQPLYDFLIFSSYLFLRVKRHFYVARENGCAGRNLVSV